MHEWLMDLFLYKATRIIDVLLGNYAKKSLSNHKRILTTNVYASANKYL